MCDLALLLGKEGCAVGFEIDGQDFDPSNQEIEGDT